MDKLNKLIALLRNLYNLLIMKEVNPPYCATGETPSFLLFSWVVRDKLPTVPSTVDSSRHDAAVKCNRVKKEKMKIHADAKQRARTTTGDDVLVKHAGTNGKLTSYWANDIFTIATMRRPVIIVKRKRDGKVFGRSISMVKK